MWRKTVIEAMSAVEREYRAAARGVALLNEQSRTDPAILRDAVVTRRDVQQCEGNLEDTYLLFDVPCRGASDLVARHDRFFLVTDLRA